MVNGKIRTIITFCLCLLPAAWSLAVSMHPVSSQGEIRQKIEQPLVMHIHMVHLRQYDLREGKAIAKYKFHNAGDSPVTIKRIKPSCGCIQVRMRRQGKQIQPNEEGEFYLEVDTAGESSGLHEYQIRIDYFEQADEEHLKSEHVLYRVEVPEKKVTVRPRALIFYQLGSEETSQTVQLIDFRPESSFKITDLQIDSEFLTAGEVTTTQDQYGHQQISIPVTAKGSVPSGKYTGSVIIDTDDQEFPQLRIPVLIYGPNAAQDGK